MALAPAGWAYGGFEAPYYLFVHERRDERSMPIYKEMKLLPEDMTARNVAFMAKMGLTR